MERSHNRLTVPQPDKPSLMIWLLLSELRFAQGHFEQVQANEQEVRRTRERLEAADRRVSVRCSFQRHALEVTPDGILTLLNHSEHDIDRFRASLAGETCRCDEIAQGWRRRRLRRLPRKLRALFRLALDYQRACNGLRRSLLEGSIILERVQKAGRKLFEMNEQTEPLRPTCIDEA